MAGLLTRPSVRSVAATSSALVSRPYCVEIASYPSARSAGITLLKHEPSAQMPWANTMLGLVEDIVGSSARSDSRPKAADRHHRHGLPTTAVSISRLHSPTHTDCGQAADTAVGMTRCTVGKSSEARASLLRPATDRCLQSSRPVRRSADVQPGA